MKSKYGAPVFYIAIELVMTVLIAGSKGDDGKLIYNTSTIVLCVELLKLGLSLLAVKQEGKFYELQALQGKTLLVYMVPALLYAINNNIFLYVLTAISPAVFQVLLNLRVMWTAIGYQFILGRPVTRKQWIACGLLVVGACFTQQEVVAAGDWSSLFSTGLVISLLYALISTAAGISCEVLLKSNLSINSSNSCLYGFGVLMNIVTLLLQSSSSEEGAGVDSAFRGWEYPRTWMIMFLMAFNGLAISRVMRRFDAIVKIICMSICNVLMYVYEVMNGTSSVSLGFLIAFLCITKGAQQYQAEAEKAKSSSSGVPRTSDNVQFSKLSQQADDDDDDDIELQQIELQADGI